MKIPKFLKENVLLKITSLNSLVVLVRLVVSFFIQRELAVIVGRDGYAKIGSLRNLLAILGSTATLGVFTGVVKYVSEFKDDKEQLQKLFSTVFVFTVIGSIVSFCVLFFGATYLSNYFFYSTEYSYVIKLVAVIVPFIAVQRVFNGVVNGLSSYKVFAKIELVAYLLGALLLLVLLYNNHLDGALIAIALTPVIQLGILLFLFVKISREYIQFSKLSFKMPMLKSLLSFTLMSFVATVLINYLEIDLRAMLTKKLTEADAGIWTGMTLISKNYMVFSGALFTLYVMPKFASIHNKKTYVKEVLDIYKLLLPLFGVGMLIVYFMRFYIIKWMFIDFYEMAPLFKWQLLADFVKLASMIVAYQFLAKKMVRNFIFSELLSLVLYFGLAYWLTDVYGLEGVVMANLLRYLIYFVVVIFLVWRYFRKQTLTASV